MDIRLRFFNFNMANSSDFEGLAELLGPGGRGKFEGALQEPFADGGPVDLAFVSLVETRLALGEWLQQYLAQGRRPLDGGVTTGAAKEGAKKSEWSMRGWLDGLAEKYNGNLKTVVAFNRGRFREDEAAALFGRMTETKVAGIPVPNPKKAFIGRTFLAGSTGLRLCFVGAHFPVLQIAAALEEQDGGDPLLRAKESMARLLRKILREASATGLADTRTAIFVQGDLNSRTVLRPDGGVKDVLLEVLHDPAMQAAIAHELDLPPGEWFEIGVPEEAQSLPVTYKYGTDVGTAFQRRSGGAQPARSLTLGDVLRASQPQHRGRAVSDPEAPSSAYFRTLRGIPPEQLRAMGLAFKEDEFRPFRFPACADRLICWAPDSLGARLSWTMPRGGCEVNHQQAGSDHRPVTLDLVLHVAPPAPPNAACEKSRRRAVTKVDAALVKSISAGEAEDLAPDR